MEIVNLIAILVSPVLAVLISIWIQTRKEKRQAQMAVFNVLVATRHSPVTEECVRALNMIDVVFAKQDKVRQRWLEYYEMVGNEGLNNPLGWQQRNAKMLELIHEMAKCLGYGKDISHLDFSRVYYPVGLGKQAELGQEITQELLRVLKNSQGFAVVAKDGIACSKEEA